MYKKKQQQHKDDYKFELVLANGRSRKFLNGNDMFNWARQVCPLWKFDLKDEDTKKES